MKMNSYLASRCGEGYRVPTSYQLLPVKLVTQRLLWMLLLVLVSAGGLEAQTYTGGITGTVTDPAGSVLTGAQVTITNTATNETRSAISDQDGRFTFLQLLPATYTLRVNWRNDR